MRGELMLVVVALAIPAVLAATCSYSGTTSCGWWSRCSKTLYRSCVHGGWSAWTERSRTACSRSCGTGNQIVTKERACTNPPPSGGGRSCSGSSNISETVSCNTQPCSVHGVWTNWIDWESTTKCTVLCGGGKNVQTRDRSCTNPAPSNGGSACAGEDRQNRTSACNTDECGDRCPEGENTYIADSDPRYFYHCQQGQDDSVNTTAILMRCPEETVWSQTSTTCVHKPSDPTPPPAPEPELAPTCTEGASRADPDDCSFYLQCVGGSETKRPCAPGTKFDNSLGLCNFASLVNCS